MHVVLHRARPPVLNPAKFPYTLAMETTKRYSALRDTARFPLIKLKATPTILDILDFLQGRILPSHYIKAQFGGPYYVKTLLGEMVKAHLIEIPDEGKMHLNARYRPRPWQIAPLGERMLLEHGRLRAIEKLGSSSFRHDYLASIVQFSFDRAEHEIPNLKKRTLADILAHPGCPDPKATSEVPEAHIRPDAPLFGFEYTQPSGFKKYFYFHGFEADRGTENKAKGYERQTLRQKLDHYAAYLSKRMYDRRYGIGNCSCAWIFVHPDRAEGFLEMAGATYPQLADKILVKVVPDFLHFDDFPPPTAWALTADWRTCNGALNILDILKGERSGRRAKTGEATGAEATA
jgi:hypothetical protein